MRSLWIVLVLISVTASASEVFVESASLMPATPELRDASGSAVLAGASLVVMYPSMLTKDRAQVVNLLIQRKPYCAPGAACPAVTLRPQLVALPVVVAEYDECGSLQILARSDESVAADAAEEILVSDHRGRTCSDKKEVPATQVNYRRGRHTVSFRGAALVN